MTLNDLLAERSIYRNLVAFARAMDERDGDAFANFTVEDMTASLGQGEIECRDAIVTCIRSFLDGRGPTQHLLGNVVIDVDRDTAKSSAYVSDMHIGNADKSGLTIRTLGRYSDEWVNVDGVWRMTRRVKDSRATIGSMKIFSK